MQVTLSSTVQPPLPGCCVCVWQGYHQGLWCCLCGTACACSKPCRAARSLLLAQQHAVLTMDVNQQGQHTLLRFWLEAPDSNAFHCGCCCGVSAWCHTPDTVYV